MGLFSKKNNITYENLTDRYIDKDGKEWISQYHYDEIDIQPTSFKKKNYSVNQPVNLIVTNTSNNMSEMDSVKVMIDEILLGYISAVGQRRMIRDYSRIEGRLVLAQISMLSFSKVSLRIIYYKSKEMLDGEAAQYEKEKSSYERMPPKTFITSLIGNQSERMQFELSHGKVGMKVECNEDDERYLVETSDSWRLGYVPKKITNEIEKLIDLGYEISSCEIIDMIIEEGKTNIKVQILLSDMNYR